LSATGTEPLAVFEDLPERKRPNETARIALQKKKTHNNANRTEIQLNIAGNCKKLTIR
jgi:hypothetical protein